MYRSLFYKEWLKIRWALLLMLVLGLVVLTNIFLRIRYNLNLSEANELWYRIVIQGGNYASMMKFIPLLAGIGIAIAQYFPETINQRIKLTFHLPIRENKVLLIQHSYGFACLTGVFLVFILFFYIGSSLYFPREIIQMTLVTILPWFVGGVATYSLVALILLEPLWLYRILYAIVSYGFISQFYIRAVPMAYIPVLAWLIMFSVLLLIVVLFSGYRFRKGEMHHG